MSRRIVVISAGLSQPSSTRLLADQLADATRSAVGGRGESLDVEFVELRELAVEMAQAMVSGNIPTPGLEAVRRQLAEADGLIAVTPIFTASYSGLFKMFFDLLDKDSLSGMPVLIAATAGTPRHSLVLEHAMRPLLAYLRAVVVPTAVFAATEDFGADELESRVHRAAAELAALVVAERTGVAGFAQGAE
ncbi:FMN reductase, partial [Janibacter anophelis]|uniref:FMN reductase n=1 Tax=Janibacter anophelis TaxID=319054 RepID=UPI000DEFF119